MSEQTSKVFFAGMRARSSKDNKQSKVARLFELAGFNKFIKKNELVAIKVHFGERGNDTFISPIFARTVVDKIHNLGAKPFLTDTNTLYSGSRHNSIDHLSTAIEHGFGFATVNAPLIIADGLRSTDIRKVAISGKIFNEVKIAGGIVDANSMIVLSHFKGHELAGFGGAIKNLAMGCATAEGKKEQHDVIFKVHKEKCISCAVCLKVCPEKAISFINKKAFIDSKLCIGCGECCTVCPAKAIDIEWETELVPFTQRMVEYAYGAIKNKENKVGYINFLMNITPDCDCAAWSDAPLVPDIGILSSTDPVALDKACYDLVNQQLGLNNSSLKCNHAQGEDKFKGAWDYTIGHKQISIAEELGMGTNAYTLVEV